MQGKPVRRVVIAGGGTAGWTIAAALAHNLGGLIDITLVESDQIGTIGVGESTIPTARRFHELIGLAENEFLSATKASFKLGIQFENWSRKGESYIHSFGVTGRGTWMADFHHMWLRARELGMAGGFGEYCLEHEAAIAERFLGGNGTPLNYAYHLDATAYGQFLRGRAEGRGVNRVEGKIAEVRLDPESGFIASLVLESGEVVEGDLFIDCTGFHGLLIEQSLSTGYEEWTHWLPTNRALAVQTESVAPPKPYTRAIAHQAGWRWQIPLQHRVGNGLVYCSEHMSDDEAHALLTAEVEGDMVSEPRLIRFVTGTRRKAWNRNCIAIGLASGFVEPLESTSIHLIMVAATRLMQMFPFGGVSDAVVERYNDVSKRELEGIRDFIILHYHLNQREEDFWTSMAEMDVPASLAHRIALFSESAQAYQAADELFRIDSWVQVMLGQGLLPQSHHALAELMGTDQLSGALAALKGNIARAVGNLPTHGRYLEGVSGN